MTYYQVRLSKTIEKPWTDMEPLYIGDVPKGLGTPSYYCAVEHGEEPYQLEPYRLLNLYGASQFEEAKIWDRWLVLGFGSYIYFVPLGTGEPIFFDIGYFWSLYTANDYLFVTSASKVFCYDRDARLLWQTEDEEVGFHGINISLVHNGRVMGIGQWPPFDEPAGQIPFVLSLHTGKLIKL